MSSSLATLLLDSADYRAFLRSMIKHVQSVDPKFSYAQCAYFLGFQSRNAVRDIVDGRRRMTSSSLRKLISICDRSQTGKRQELSNRSPAVAWKLCLQLSSEQLRFLEGLVYIDEADLDPQGRPTATLLRDLERMRRKLRQQLTPEIPKAKREELYKSLHWTRVYAALGGDEGASPLEIQQRTGLAQRVIDPIVQRLIETELVTKNGDRYRATSQSLHLSNLADSEHFKIHFQNALRNTLSRSQRHFDDPQSLFLALHFSASKSRMTELCQAIKAVALDFANLNEQPDGDCVIRLTLALTH